MKLKPCKICGSAPELIDDRLVFYVRCENHPPPIPVVYGDNHRYIDNMSSRSAREAIKTIDWDAVKASAITNWNLANG